VNAFESLINIDEEWRPYGGRRWLINGKPPDRQRYNKKQTDKIGHAGKQVSSKWATNAKKPEKSYTWRRSEQFKYAWRMSTVRVNDQLTVNRRTVRGPNEENRIYLLITRNRTQIPQWTRSKVINVHEVWRP